MKLTILLLTVALIQVYARGVSQTISLSGKEIPLKKIFTVIEQQTGFVIFYNKQLLENTRPVSVTATNMPLLDFLQMSLKDQPLLFVISDNTIILSEKPAGDLNHRLYLPPPPITVRGRILSENGEPVVASVTIKGTGRGTTSDANGYFQLDNVEETAVLIISATNIETVTIKVNGQTNISVAVKTVTISLDEVVVNKGYYTERKQLSTGNVSKVTAKDIERQPVTNPLMALQGRVPGLEITPRSGTPGNAPIIRVRGQNSLRPDGSFPLYIIDGIPINSAPIQSWSGVLMTDGYDPLSTINPANIASIEVLKDADATAIYGSRGANGVILITTKQGSNASGTNLEISAYKGIGKIQQRLDLLSTEQYLAMRNEAFSNDGATPQPFYFDVKFWDTTRYTDWQEELLGGTADITDLQAAVSGGNGNTSYRLGGGYHQESLIFPGNFGYQRASTSLSVNHLSSDRKFEATVSVNYGLERHRLLNAELVGAALTLPPDAPNLYDEDGELNWATHPVYKVSTWINPLANTNALHKSSNRNLVANGSLAYEIINGLLLKINLGYTDLNGDEQLQKPFSSMKPDNRYSASNPFGLKASASFGDVHRQSFLVEPQLTYIKQFGQHSFNFVLGSTYQKNINEYQLITGDGYTSDALLGSIRSAALRSFPQDEVAEYKYNAVFGRIGYNIQEKYILNLTGRRDGSSRFSEENRFGNFGAIGAAWIFSKERFIENNISFLSFGKIRGSYGTTGNDQIGDYQYYNLYAISNVNYQNDFSLSPDALYNPDYVWEKTKKLEAAIELGFVNNRYSLEVAWYRNRSSNQLVTTPLPLTTGFQGITANWGATVENSGLEMLVRADIIQKTKFNWSASLNLTKPDNKLVAFPDIEQTTERTKYKVGEPLSIRRLYKWKGVNPQTGLHEFADVNNDGFINDDDKQFMSSAQLKYYGGLNNSLRYRSFELSFLFQFIKQTGIKEFSTSMPGEVSNQTARVLGRWQKQGDLTDVQKFSQQTNGIERIAYANFLASDGNITDASFIRLKTVSVSFLLDKFLQKLKIEQARIYVQGQNLFTISNSVTLDPETGYSLPPLRMITAGLQFKF